jgi:DNA helicase-2/ATP-dependent DNA helicase PcrA
MNLHEVLNDKQVEAATYLDSNLRIIAGAGSGKTRVITYRIAYLIDEIGIDPSSILAITFTNKAANEMKQRVENILGIGACGSTICTIHSLCVRILRQNIKALGYPSHFIIMDEEDQKSLIKKIFKENNIDSKQVSIKSCINYISSCKMAMVDPQRALLISNNYEGEVIKANIYGKYEVYKEEHYMLDFDDLLLKTIELFENYPDILEKWQRKYSYIHVDEFQDVGEIDYKLVYYLSGQATLCVVGDPDQTIYSFRGSDVNYILDFDKDYKNTKTIILDQNYRSTQNILDISNTLIRKNKNRLEKDLFTELDQGTNIVHYSGVDDNAEAEFITNKIEEIISNVEGVNYRDFAILYRANYLSRPIEQSLIKKQMTYRIFGGLKFFNRKEIKDALSYIRLIVANDDLSFERIVNVPGRGIGNKTLEKIQLYALNHGLSCYEAISLYSDEIGLSSKIKKELKVFIEAIEEAKHSKLSLSEILERLLNKVGYMEMLKKDNDENRIMNILELQNSINNYVKENPETATFENYLQDIALYTSTDEINDDQYISLMSIHMAKGLEFNYVFVVGLSDDTFPSFRSISEGGDEGLEEERRLAYVAFTRAKKELYLTESQGYSFMTKSPKIASRFIDEIGEDHVVHLGKSNNIKKTTNINMQSKVMQNLYNDEEIDFKNGDIIEHDSFGKGIIVKVEGKFISVAFSMPYGIKTLIANHKAIHKIVN